MATETEDILVPIPDEDLPELAKMYEEHTDTIPHIFSAINTLIKFRKCEEIKELSNIYSLNNCWKKDGTFIILYEFGCYILVIFTLDKNCKALLDGLTQTKRINYEGICVFFCVHYDHHPTILQLIKIKKLKVIYDTPCNMYSIKKEIALNYNFECPEEVYLKKLDKSDASIVNSFWANCYPGSPFYLSNLIEFSGGYGLCLKSDSKLVAWVLKSVLGQLGMSTTIPECSNKGYASYLTKLTSKEIAEEGHEPLGTVLVDKVSSETIFQKLGFETLGYYTYVKLGPL